MQTEEEVEDRIGELGADGDGDGERDVDTGGSCKKNLRLTWSVAKDLSNRSLRERTGASIIAIAAINSRSSAKVQQSAPSNHHIARGTTNIHPPSIPTP